jgi:hypothetical protein
VFPETIAAVYSLTTIIMSGIEIALEIEATAVTTL